MISLESRENKTCTYNIIDGLQMNITITENPYDLNPDSLFQMAARINKKRGFLFVSKVLGKHIPVQPATALAVGALLADRYIHLHHQRNHPLRNALIQSVNSGIGDPSLLPKLKETKLELPERTLFIGFAETATALGHSMFNCFQNAVYFHTTREEISYMDSVINFEEEHSHATSHRCYIKPSIVENNHPVVLVDDEMTTGKTALNIIESIHELHPRKHYTVVSILDWRSRAQKEKFREMEKKLGIEITEVSLLSGEIVPEGYPVHKNEEVEMYNEGRGTVQYHAIPSPSLHNININEGIPFLSQSGRFGITSDETSALENYLSEIGDFLKGRRKGTRTLCMGTGEFMYIPMGAAAEMGKGVFFQSTTRSPIYPHKTELYGAKSRYTFDSIETPGVVNYFYNVEKGQYDEVFLFIERGMQPQALESWLKHARNLFSFVHIVPFSK
ncbi:phosphoribosyltransferase-like predicted ribonucleoside biosynthesis protein [Falsibacillus pallidus]|uniref:Phosphoribosyltransferase-like predicted ribonucleoside biosynthesis protein n=1 Tax=Falsibacillus pallidus TaxID=493781 RepID=A0A370GRR3_9BACI|nr:phosphoribosyltransferase-like predicted ribonucleoside biosynthesis protein [Falsibacillus pallidus]